MDTRAASSRRSEVLIGSGRLKLPGFLEVPAEAQGLVLFAHGSGSGRYSSRNQQVAAAFREAGLATLLFGLLTEMEEHAGVGTTHPRFDVPLLAVRLRLATAWTQADPELAPLPLGYFGASTSAAAVLIAAAKETEVVRAVVSRGGRPDLAGAAVAQVAAPTLLIVGGDNQRDLELNRQVFEQLRSEKRLEIVPGASHLFEEPGALNAVTDLAGSWFCQHLAREESRP
jgi:putative phosphoribosyl transferase